MKLNLTFIFVITFLSFGLISCNSPEPAQTTDNTNALSGTQQVPIEGAIDNNVDGPRIVFESKLVELGKIGPETKASDEFRFTNEGNALLEIEKVSQCCGVVISYDKSKYEPGEKGVIKVSFTSNKQTGKIRRNPVVFSNDPVNPELVLLIIAEVVNKVVAKPENLKLFLDEENAGCPKLTVSSIDGKEFAVRGIQSTGNCITTQVDPDYKATQIELDLKVDMDKLKMNNTGFVDVVVTHPDMSILTLPYDVVSRYTVYPPKLTKLDAEPEKPYEREIFVYNKYNQRFEIESVTSKNNYIKLIEGSITVVNDGYQINVLITPPPKGDKASFSDELYIQIKNGEKLIVDYNGYFTID